MESKQIQISFNATVHNTEHQYTEGERLKQLNGAERR